MTVQVFHFRVGDEDANRRLDRFLADCDPPGITRSQVRKSLDEGHISVNGHQVKAGYSLCPGDEICWRYEAPVEPTAKAQPIEFDVLYDDNELAIIDKPSDLVVHPATGHPDQTLVNGLAHRFGQLSTLGGELRPGIVHRLDRDTTGALAVAKTDEAHRHLSDQFREHSAKRIYHALVHGPGLDDEGTFETGHARHPQHRVRFTGRIGGKRDAITHYRVRERFASGACLVECRLETGRTHQIRMHFYEAHAPLLGDPVYGGRATSSPSIIDRQALHALVLGVEHPDGRWIECRSPYPADFQAALDALRQGRDWR